MPKSKFSEEDTLKLNNFLDEEEPEKELPIEEKSVVVEEPKKLAPKQPKKEKKELTILSIKKGRITASYIKNGVKYGVSFPFDDKYKDKKPGDVIVL